MMIVESVFNNPERNPLATKVFWKFSLNEANEAVATCGESKPLIIRKCYKEVHSTAFTGTYKQLHPEFGTTIEFIQAQINLYRALCVGCCVPAEDLISNIVPRDFIFRVLRDPKLPYKFRMLFNELLYEVYVEKIFNRPVFSSDHAILSWSQNEVCFEISFF